MEISPETFPLFYFARARAQLFCQEYLNDKKNEPANTRSIFYNIIPESFNTNNSIILRTWLKGKVVIQSIKSIKLLHVDDDPNQFIFIKSFLNKSDPDMDVTCVSEPEKVFELLETGEYHCLVTDYDMPKINGIELAVRVREKYSIPIILYTGQGSEKVAEKAFSVGIDDYLRKEMDPSHYQVLAKRIRHAVDKKQVEILHENVMNHAHLGVCIFVNGVIAYANNAAIKMFEKKNLNEILETNPFSRGNKEGLEFLEYGEHELVAKKRNGDKIYFEISSRSISYFGNEATLSVVRDITEKKVLEIETFVSQERFRSLVELSPDGIATFSTTGYMTFLNSAFCSLTGFSKEELLGEHLINLKTLRKRDLLKYIRSFTAVLQGKMSPSMEFTYYKKDGTSGVGESHIGLIDVSGTKEMLLIARDITERKNHETRYEKLFETSPDGVIELDINENIITINDTLIQQTGLKEFKLLGKNIYNIPIFDNETKEELKKVIEKIKHTKNIRSLEFGLTRSDQSRIWIEANISPILFDKEVFGYQLIMRDISKRKETEEEHRKYSKKLEKLVEIKTNENINNERLIVAGKVASMIGHDIRSPLQTIKNCVYLLKKTYNDPLLTNIEDQLKYTVELISRFEDQTKTDLIKLEYCSIPELIENIMFSFSINNNIEVISSISSNIPLMRIDEFQFRRVLVNIINNSIQAMPKGGRLLISAEIKNDALELSVADSGIGIPEDKLQDIFNPFYTTKKEGIGLGLSFCKSMVEDHGGTIEVTSEENVGTTIFIRIPIVPVDSRYIDIEMPVLDIEQ